MKSENGFSRGIIGVKEAGLSEAVARSDLFAIGEIISTQQSVYKTLKRLL